MQITLSIKRLVTNLIIICKEEENILVEKIWHVTFFRKCVVLEHEWWNTSQLTAKIAQKDAVEHQSVGFWQI